MKKKFKVLMYGQGFVNASMLKKGIYTKEVPDLRPIDTTIDSIIGIYTAVREGISNAFVVGEYEKAVENLKKCYLAEVELTVLDTPVDLPGNRG